MFATFENSRLVDALGWALVHFLWQGAALALLAFLLLRLCHHAPALLRHAIAYGTMLAMACAPVATGIWIDAHRPTAATFRKSTVVRANSLAPVLPHSVAEQAVENDRPVSTAKAALALPNEFANGLQWLESQLGPALPAIVAIWALGVLALSLRFCVGWIGVLRLVKCHSIGVDDAWRERIESLARQVGVRRVVRFVRSNKVDVPAVVGWLRPVVLAPAAVFTGLSTRELEALLLHELAHIRRHDYLANLVQAAIETLLFFHPCVWWMSSLARETREECCDAIAADACQDRLVYARSLASLEEFRAGRRRLAMAADGGNLLHRIRRLVDPQFLGNARSAWSGWVAVGVVGVAAWAVFANASVPQDDWGPERDGLRLRLSIEKKAPVVGCPVLLKLELKNVTERTIEHDDQSLSAFRVLRVTGPDGLPIAYSGPSYQTAGSPEPIDPGATKVIWQGVDLAKSFVLAAPGKYTVWTARADYPFRGVPGSRRGNVANYPASNRLEFELAPGKLSEPLATFVRMQSIAPAGWRASLSGDALVYIHSPTGLKKDVAMIQLWKSDGPELDAATKSRLEKAGDRIEYIVAPSGMHLHIAGQPAAAERWPDYVTVIKQALAQPNNSPRLPQSKPQALDMPGPRRQTAVAKSKAVSAVHTRNGNDARDKFRIVAAPQGRDAKTVWLRLQQSFEAVAPLRGKSPQPGFSMTDQETIVSARPLRTVDGITEVEFADLSLPEGSGLVAEIEGEGLESKREAHRTVLLIKSGLVRLVDALGIERARLTPRYGKLDLAIEASADANDEVHIRVFHTPGPHLAGRLALSMDAETGRPKGEKQPPHGSVRYAIEHATDASMTIRLKMQWRYDLDKLQAVSQTYSGVVHPARDPYLTHVARGTVRDQQGKPIEGVLVRAATGMGTLLGGGSTRTDRDGRYELRFGKGISMSIEDKVQFQVATISASKPGYYEGNLNRQGNYSMADSEPPAGSAKNFVGVILPGRPVEIDFAMLPAVAIAGTVLDRDGKPLEGVRVSLTGKELPPSSSVVAQTRTDKGGRFRLADIPAGYRFQLLVEPSKAEPPWHAWATGPIEFFPSGSESLRLKSGLSEATTQRLELQLVHPPKNWREALKSTADASAFNPPTPVHLRIVVLRLEL